MLESEVIVGKVKNVEHFSSFVSSRPFPSILLQHSHCLGCASCGSTGAVILRVQPDINIRESLKMQNVEQDHAPKDANVITRGVDDLSDSDVQQVTGKNYDPAPDKRDMRRLGKRQELKVHNESMLADCILQLTYCSVVSASSPSLAMLSCWVSHGNSLWFSELSRCQMVALREQSGSPSLSAVGCVR